jgi:hypothetical protein
MNTIFTNATNVVFLSLIIASFAIASSTVRAGEMTAAEICAPTKLVLKSTDLFIGQVSNGVDLVDEALRGYLNALDVGIEMQEVAHSVDQTAEEMTTLSGDAASVTEPVQNIATVFENLQRALKVARSAAFTPANVALTQIMKDIDATDQESKLRSALNKLDRIKAKIVPIKTDISRLKKLTTGACYALALAEAPSARAAPSDYRFIQASGQRGGAFLSATAYTGEMPVPKNIIVARDQSMLQASSANQCKRELQQELDAVESTMQPVNNDIQALGSALSEVGNFVKRDVLPIFHPFSVIERPMNDIHTAVLAIHSELMQFKNLLKHKFKITATVLTVKVTLINTSVQSALNGWKKSIKRIEDDFHITEIKKMMEKEMDAIMKPVTKAISDEIKHIEKSVKIDGFSLSDAKAAARKLLSNLENMGDIANAEASIKKSAEKMESTLSRCATH